MDPQGCNAEMDDLGNISIELGRRDRPVTFEIVKRRLWQINDEQGIAIKTISASPIVVEGNDFNVGLFTRDAGLVRRALAVWFTLRRWAMRFPPLSTVG